jgi:hypothetical protein
MIDVLCCVVHFWEAVAFSYNVLTAVPTAHVRARRAREKMVHCAVGSPTNAVLSTDATEHDVWVLNKEARATK